MKNTILTKLIASLLVITLTIANFLLIGKETYAIFEPTEGVDSSNIDAVITNELEKYIRMKNIGVLVQFSTYIDKIDEYDNTGEKQIKIKIPEINGKLPINENDVSIIKYNSFEYSKKYENGQLTIYLEDFDYLKYFKIVCIYPEDAFENNVEKEISTTLKSKDAEMINVKNTIELIEEQGEITNLNAYGDIIYKGLMYKNIENENYETTYQEEGNIETSYILNNTVSFNETSSEFIGKENNKIDATTYFNETRFSMLNLKNTLGDNFKVIVSDGNSQYILDKETKTEEDGDTLLIKYPEKINGISISTSEVISTEEPIMFKNYKTMITNNTRKTIIKDISKLETAYSINNNNGIITTYLKEPYLNTNIELDKNKTQLTALSDNDVNILITLITNQEDRDLLYNNPTLKIKMPTNVTVKELKNVTIAGGDGTLEINSYDIDNEGNIIVTLNGEQKNYIETIYNTQISINAILEVNKLIVNTRDYFKIEASNKDSKNIYENYSDQINISTYSNLLTYLQIENFDDNGNKIEIYNEGENAKQINCAKVAGQTIKVNVATINNYEIDLKNVSINVNAKYTNKNGETINLNMNEKDGNENYTGIDDDIDRATKKSIALNLSIPNEIDYNEKIEIELEVKYSIEGEKYSQSLKGTLYTETKNNNMNSELLENEKITMQTTAQLADGTVLKEGDSVYEGETITYTTTITNNTNKDIKNVNVKAIVTNGKIYGLKGIQMTNPEMYEGIKTEYKYEELDTNEIVFDTIETLGTEPVAMTYETVVQQVEEGQNIESLVNVNADDFETSSKITNKIQQADLKLNIARRFTETVDVYSTYLLDTAIKVENLSGKDLQDVILKVYLKDGLLWDENKNINVYSKDYSEQLDIAKIQSWDEENKILTIQIENLEKDSIININCDPTVEKISLDKLESEASIYVVANDKYKSNSLKKKVLQSELGLSVSLESDVKGGTKLKTGDEVTMTAKIKNTGIKSGTIEIKYEIPYGLKLQGAKSSDGKEVNIYNEKSLDYFTTINSNGEIVLECKFTVDTAETLNETCSNIVKVEHNYETINSNEIAFELDLDYIPGENDPSVPDKPDIPDTPDNPKDPETPDTPTNPDAKYELSGTAWLDENKDGKRDNEEKVLEEIKIRLLDSKNNNNFLKDSEGNIIETTTKKDGSYKFTDIPEGKYLAVFEYDTTIYEITEYQKEGISEEFNSDVLDYVLMEDNNSKNVGITKTIDLNENISNIDIGLRYLPKFDLKIDKYITKVTTQTSLGTTMTEYQGTKFAKAEIKRQYLEGATLIIEYTIKITNAGELAGYVNKIVDNMPEDMQFKSELNKSWYIGTGGKLYNNSLSDLEIKPNESQEIKLILVKNMTKNNTGSSINTAEIEEYTNNKELEDIDLTNNKASATMIITPATGEAMIYTIIVTLSLGIIGVGIYFIKRKVIG